MQTLEALDRAVDAARGTDAAESLVSGVMLVRTQLFRILQEEGLERISVLGLPFDRRTAEAVQRKAVSDPDQDGLVIQELQGGHQIRGHVLRRAKVVVGEFVEDAAEATLVMPSLKSDSAVEPPPLPKRAAGEAKVAAPPAASPLEPAPEPTVAMPALDEDRLDRTAVGGFGGDDRPEPTVAMPVVAEEKPSPSTADTTPGTAEVTVAMRAGEIEAVMGQKAAPAPPKAEAAPKPAPSPARPVPPPPRTAAPPPRPSAPPPRAATQSRPAPPPPPEPAEEQIVVEDWNEPTPPATVIDTPPPVPTGRAKEPPWGATQSDAPPRAARRPAAPPPPDDEEEDDGANATMVLADSASLFTRPAAPAPPAAPPTPPRAAPTAASAEAAEWKPAQHWEGDPNATHPVPRGERGPAAPGQSARASGPPPLPSRPRASAPTPVPRPRASTPAAPPPLPRGRGAPAAEPPPHRPRSGPAAAAPGAARRPADAGGRGPLYVGIGVVALVLALAVGLAVWLVVRGRTGTNTADLSPAPAVPSPSPEVAAPVQEEVINVGRPTPTPEATTLPQEEATPIPVPTSAVPTPVAPVATAPTAPPVATTTSPPRPTTTPPPVNPVPGLMAQARQAEGGGRYGDAIRLYGDVLKIEPNNQEAATGRLRATGSRASQGRYFLTAVTMSEGEAKGGGIPGFGGASVAKARCDCAIVYEVSPESPVQDQPYTVSIYLQNDSKRDIKPQDLNLKLTINGRSTTKAVPLAAKEVKKGARAMIGKFEDRWPVGTTGWSMEAAVRAGDSTYKSLLTWELKL